MTPTLLVARETDRIARTLWATNPDCQRLIYPIEPGVLHDVFERELKALAVNWQPHIRVDSTRVMMEMVATCRGVSIGLELPEAALHRGIRAIPLKGFDWISVTVCWKTRSQPVVTAAVAIIRETARQQWRVECDKIAKR